MNSLVSSRKTPTSGLRKSFRIRSNACTNSSGVSARITPRLPESASGLSTQGKVISAETTSGRGFECEGNLLKAGTLSPASRNRSRERYLSRQMSVASGGCPRKPSLWQARAPVDVGRSPMETIASRGWDAAKSQILCTEASESSKRRGRAPSCHGSSSTWQRSVPKVMDSPNFCAASIKAHVWYPVVVHNTRSLFGWEVPIMAGPNRCNQFSSRAQPPPDAHRNVSQPSTPTMARAACLPSAVVTSRLTRSVARRSPSPSVVLHDCKMGWGHLSREDLYWKKVPERLIKRMAELAESSPCLPEVE